MPIITRLQSIFIYEFNQSPYVSLIHEKKIDTKLQGMDFPSIQVRLESTIYD